MELIILGTSAMVPTKDRNHSAALLLDGGEGVLVDCGEGTQRQLKQAGISQAKITRICITHWHGDHVLGLPGLLMTIAQAGQSNGTLYLYGPKGIKQQIRAMIDAFPFEQRLDLQVEEVSRGVVFETDKMVCTVMPLEHGIPCVGYRVEQKDRRRIHLPAVKKLGIPDGPLLGKLQNGEEVVWKGKPVHPKDTTYVVTGKKVAFVSDTKPCRNAHELAENCDLLLCEASYSSRYEDKAEEYTHMTARQAGQLASQAGVQKLCITHFSARYATTTELLEDAKTAFENTIAAHDLMKIDVDKIK